MQQLIQHDCWLQVMVFMSSCNSVKFHGELLNYIDIPVKDIHGKQKQQKRTTTFFEFCQADKVRARRRSGVQIWLATRCFHPERLLR